MRPNMFPACGARTNRRLSPELPQAMSEPAGQPQQPLRTWRPMAAGTAGRFGVGAACAPPPGGVS